MSDKFDPYHQWLGIAPQSQPPDHYRLLGIELFEQDLDVIDAAASRQSLALRELGVGEHADAAQTLLDAIGDARVCLLNPDQKAQYDESVRHSRVSQGQECPDVNSTDLAEPGYHLWLGIPPHLQPPSHYRLLGIELFETVPGVIEAAAQRQGAYLRQVSNGPHRKLSQSLLNDVAAARRCLLDEAKKQSYDEDLQRQLSAESTAEPDVVADNATPGQSQDTPATVETDTPSERVSVKQPKRARSPKPDRDPKTSRADDTPGSTPARTSKVGKDAADPTHKERRKPLFLVIGSSCVGLLVLAGIAYAVLKPDTTADQAAIDQSDAGRTTPIAQSPDAPDKPVSPNTKKKRDPGAEIGGQLTHWTFDEKNAEWARNEVGPLILTMHGHPKFVPGPFGSAVQLDGKDDAIDVPVGSLEARAGTIAFWARRDSDELDRPDILISTANKGTRYILKLSPGGDLRGTLGPQPLPLSTSIALEPHVWYHVALTWERDGRATLYCNARRVGGIDDAGQMALPEGLRIGQATRNGKASFAQVSIDDVRCFERAVTPQELIELVRNPAAKLKDPIAASASPPPDVATVTPTGTEDKPPTLAKPPATNTKAKKPAPKPPPVVKPPPARQVVFPGGSGNLPVQVWAGLEPATLGSLKTAISEKKNPSRGKARTSLAAGQKPNDRIARGAGQRIRGILIPPLDGTYKFEVKFVDAGQFLLSDTAGSRSTREVKTNEQVELSKVHTYYFEILHLNSGGAGEFQIGWTLPSGAREAVIPASRLIWAPHWDQFQPLPIARFESTEGLTLTAVENTHHLLAAGDIRKSSTFILDSVSDITRYSIFRLDALFDASVNSNGPGLGSKGMFAVNEVELAYQEPGATEFIPVPLNASAAHAGVPSRLTDGDESTSWTVTGREHQNASVLLVPGEPLVVKPRTKLRFTVRQKTPMGLFRICGTSSSANYQTVKFKQQVEKSNEPYRLFVNVGGGTVTDPKLKIDWVRSKTFSNNSWGFTGGTNKTDAKLPQPVFKSAVEGITAFRATVPNGVYQVNLYFSDNWVVGRGKRVFDVQIESDDPVRVDVFAARGAKKALELSRRVRVTGGRLDVVFKAVAGKPILNAVSITD